MTKILQALATVAMSVFILAGGYYLWTQLKAQPGPVSQVSKGEFKDLQQLVVQEQTNNYSRFARYENESPTIKVLRFLPFAGDLGKASIVFQWQARTLYGISISDESPLRWERFAGTPGAIHISVPPLRVLETKIDLAKDRLVMVTMEKSKFLSTESKKLEELPKLQEMSDEEARLALTNDTLKAKAKQLIAFHVIGIVNQGASTADKIHSAVVEFRDK